MDQKAKVFGTTEVTGASTQEVPRTVGPYLLLGVLGQGGSGKVYRARGPDGGVVALKVIPAPQAADSTELKRFAREAEAIQKLRRHPNIITVYNSGKDENHCYIAMEIVPQGRTLHDIIEERRSLSERLDFAISIAKALEYVHSEGILHRDLKPGNILINDFDQPLLADFGLAKRGWGEDSVSLTRTGAVLGTPKYMAPEQCGFGDREYTVESDIYALGVVLFELFTNDLPYSFGDNMSLAEVFEVIRTKEPKPPRRINPQVGRNLEAILLKLLQKEKRLRYRLTKSLVQDLEAYRVGGRVAARRPTPGEYLDGVLRRHRALSASLVTTSLIGCLAGGYWWHRNRTLMVDGVMDRLQIVSLKKENARLTKEEEERSLAEHEGTLLLNLAGAREEIAKDNLGAAGALLNEAIQWAETQPEQKLYLAQCRHELAHLLLRQRKYSDAEVLFRTLAQWAATQRGQVELLAQCRHELARLRLRMGDFTNAEPLFRSVVDALGLDSMYGRLATFEAGVCCWLAGNRQEARETWSELTPVLQKDLDSAINPAEINRYLLMNVMHLTSTKEINSVESERMILTSDPG